jgi:MFS family permease
MGEVITEKPQETQVEEAYKLVDELPHLTDEEKALEKKLVRTLDGRILVLVVIVYFLNSIDRANVGASRLQGLQKDLDLSNTQFSSCVSVLFAGYLGMQIPSNMLLNHTGRPSLFLSAVTVAWGIVSLLTCTVKNYAGLIVCRFFLGVVEAPFFSGAMFYLSKWYTKREIGLRMTVILAAPSLSGAFGSLIAAGILSGLNNARGLPAWKWLFIIEGSVTTFIGFILYFVLPDFPTNWKHLTPEMRAVAVKRLSIDAGEADDDLSPGFKQQIHGAKLAFTDIRTYLLFFMYVFLQAGNTLGNFLPTLTATLGYNSTVSLLLCAPPYLITVIWQMGHSWLSDRLKVRFWFFVYPIPMVLCGYILFSASTEFGPRYFALCCMSQLTLLIVSCWAWTATSIQRPPAKRSVAMAFINMGGGITGIVTPYFYSSSSPPRYALANGAAAVGILISGVLAVILRFWLARLNKQAKEYTGHELTERERAAIVLTAEQEGTDFETALYFKRNTFYLL